MAEGDVHRELVRLLAGRIVGEVSHNWSSFIDGAGWDKRAGVPPMLEIHRPDIYAVERGSGRTVIGEAKTADDIDNNHTGWPRFGGCPHRAQQPLKQIAELNNS